VDSAGFFLFKLKHEWLGGATMRFETTIRLTYKDTDQMGVVYHGNYFTYFETSRTEMFRKLGYTYKELEEKGVILPVLECSCRYMRPIVYDVEITVATRIKSIKGVRINLEYEIYSKGTDILLATGLSMHAFVSKNMRPIKTSNLDKGLMEKLLESIEGM
jgi:acyl-CoA thioester hydrolase